MIDPASVAQGVATSLATQKAMPHIDTALHELTHNPSEPVDLSEKDYLHLIHLSLIEIQLLLKKQQSGQGDEFRFVTLNKPMFGSPYHPFHIGDLLHFSIYSPVAVIVNCSGTGLGVFNITIPACIWTPLDFLDGASFALDAANSFNKLNICVRETNEEVV